MKSHEIELLRDLADSWRINGKSVNATDEDWIYDACGQELSDTLDSMEVEP